MTEGTSSPSFLKSKRAVAALMRDHDWSTSSLGPPDHWESSLQTLVNLMMHSETPMFVAWGSDHVLLYNDAYIDILGLKHPLALGRTVPEIWPEIWSDIEPMFKQTLAGQACNHENVPFLIRRHAVEEEAWFRFSYSPIENKKGEIAGLFCSLTETTEQVYAAKRSLERNERFHSLFEQAPGFVVVLEGPDHIYEIANNAYFQLVGERDLIGKSLREALPELEQNYFELLDKAYTSGMPQSGKSMPTTLRRRPGQEPEERFIDIVFQPIIDPLGKVTGIFVQGNDVTEHVLIQKDLRISQERAQEAVHLAQTERRRLDALLEAAPVGIIMVGPSGELLRQNSENFRIWDKHSEVRSLNNYADWEGWWADESSRHGHQIEPHEWGMARVLQGEAEKVCDVIEIESFSKPGVRKTILNCAASVRDGNGKLIGGVGAQMDITERRQAKAALLESEAKFRTIAHAMPQMVWSTLPDGYHDYFNPQWYEFTGVPEGASDGGRWNEVFHPEDQEFVWNTWHHCLQTGQTFDAEYRLRHHSGEYRWALGRALPVRNERGQIIRWMGTDTDIHEQKLAQEALLQADKRKDEFLAMLAHELRNPLAPIAAAAELLSTLEADENRTRYIADVLKRQTGHMTSLINDLLDVSRVTRGLVTLNKTPVNIESIVSEAIEQVRPLIREDAHYLETHLPLEDVVVSGDRERLIQVLTNILNNAVKYTPEGGRIVLRMESNANEVALVIQDSGTGMSADLVARAFELFSQGEQTVDRSQGGMGIGLSLVKSLVELHGGTVTAKSGGIGLGSEFRVVLPRLSQPEAQLPLTGMPSVHSTSTAKRIMVVDDNVDAAKLLAIFLEEAGHEVYVAHDANRALQLADELTPPVCILDIGLPGMDGNELARRLRSIPGMINSVLIAVTGYGQPHDKELAFAAGFHYHFTKPVDAHEILRLISEAKSPGSAASSLP